MNSCLQSRRLSSCYSPQRRPWGTRNPSGSGRHVVGPLFLVNAVSAAVIATLLLWRGGALVQLVGLGYAVTTLTAFYVSVYDGLFGFIEALNGTPQMIAALAEATAIALLALLLARSRASARNRGRLGTRTPGEHRGRTRMHGA